MIYTRNDVAYQGMIYHSGGCVRVGWMCIICLEFTPYPLIHIFKSKENKIGRKGVCRSVAKVEEDYNKITISIYAMFPILF